MMSQRRFRRWKLAYFAAMHGDRGDVTHSFGPLNPGRLLRSLGTLNLYFVDPQILSSLPLDAPPNPNGAGLNLSPRTADRISTAGRKDLRLMSTGAPWPLQHLSQPPDAWGDSLADYLHRCAALDWKPDEIACFALDRRLEAHGEWLARHSVLPGAACTIYGLFWPGFSRGTTRRKRSLSALDWVHLATAEI
jgi:hypothetical protein